MASGSVGSRDASGLVLEAGDVRATLLPEDGGRVGSLVIGGHERHPGRRPGPDALGQLPDGAVRRPHPARAVLVPGPDHQLPLGMPPHAIHGVVWDRPWRVDDATTLSIDLDDRWPYRGRVVQRFAPGPRLR